MGTAAVEIERVPRLPEPAAALGPGSRLGRYELLGKLGVGGMAEVYLARLRCPGGFTKHLALKVLRRALAKDQKIVEMFFHEARVVAHLHHPNIVQVLELGQDDGVYYMALEYLRGVSLADIYTEVERGRRSPLAAPLACSFVMQACEGLHFVHEATDERGRPMSLVHLDISPQNLFLTTAGTIKLIDFGIARSTDLAPVVAPSPFRGKYSYSSPEQLDGAVPDRRSDVFSLGTVLWELLVGRPLFRGNNPLESLYRVSEAPIPRLGAIRRDLPPALEAVVTRALARRPAERYQTALEMLRDLARATYQMGQPITSHDLASLVREWFPEGAPSFGRSSSSPTPGPVFK